MTDMIQACSNFRCAREFVMNICPKEIIPSMRDRVCHVGVHAAGYQASVWPTYGQP
jgi:hypothetical protein